MLGSNLSVIIDKGFTLGAVKYLPLAHGEQLVAESALIKIIALLLKQQFQLFHEEARNQFVLSLFEDIKTV